MRRLRTHRELLVFSLHSLFVPKNHVSGKLLPVSEFIIVSGLRLLQNGKALTLCVADSVYLRYLVVKVTNLRLI